MHGIHRQESLILFLLYPLNNPIVKPFLPLPGKKAKKEKLFSRLPIFSRKFGVKKSNILMVQILFFRYNKLINKDSLSDLIHTTFSNFSSMYKAQTGKVCAFAFPNGLHRTHAPPGWNSYIC